VSIRGLEKRLARAEGAARAAAPRVGPATFVLHCGPGPAQIVTHWNGSREVSFAHDDSSELLGAFELDGELQIMPEAEAHTFLKEEFERRGWQPIVIVVERVSRGWQGT
jgi:hypothetical protein